MTIMQLIDWLCVSDKHLFVFNEECGKTNLRFIVSTCSKILAQYRMPTD